MPLKRRLAKAKAKYPPTVQALLDCEHIEPSQDARGALLGVYFFHDYELGDEIGRRAMAIVNTWPDDGPGGNRWRPPAEDR